MSEEIHEIQAHHAGENGKSDYGAKDIRVLEGLGSGSSPSGNVYRFHFSPAVCIIWRMKS